MFPVAIALSVVVGLAVGSFVNVVIHRVPAGHSIAYPGSACPACGHPIRARHNIPLLGWALLRGRCADCATPISIRYPLVEAAGAALFAGATLLARYRGELPLLPALLYFVAVGMALSVIDIDTHRLPNSIVLPSYPVMALLVVLAGLVSDDWWAVARGGIGMVALFGFFALLALIYPAGMGWGDVKLAGVLGILLGYVGWSALIVGCFAGFCLGAVVAIGVMAAGCGGRKTALPFGPFMVVGAAIGVLAGRGIVDGYLGVVGV